MKWFDLLLLKIAKWILMGRNLPRSKHISRKDNNWCWYAAEDLMGIIDRMKSNYERRADP